MFSSKLLVLVFVLLLFLLFKTGFLYFQPTELMKTTPEIAATAFPNPTPHKTVLDPDKLWSLVQDWRIKEGLQPYTKDQRLCVIAKDRSDDPLDYHKAFKEKIESNYYGFTQGLEFQENVVYNITNAEQALDGWLTSPPHLEALKKPWTYSCIECTSTTCAHVFSNF